MPTITRVEARQNHEALLRLAAGPTRREPNSRRLRHSATDAAVYAALVSHQNWHSGQCNPGYRAIARLARVGLATITEAMRRLRAAGFLAIRRHPIRVPGHGYRWAHSYILTPQPAADLVPEMPRSDFATKPENFRVEIKSGWKRALFQRPAIPEPVRSVSEQLAILAPFIETDRARRATAGGAGSSP